MRKNKIISRRGFRAVKDENFDCRSRTAALPCSDMSEANGGAMQKKWLKFYENWPKIKSTNNP
jgi:hypothetical protein